MKKSVIAIILLVLIGGVFVNRVKIKNLWSDLSRPEMPQAVEYQEIDKKTENFLPESDSLLEEKLKTEDQRPKTEDLIPTSFNLNVPFTSQAPFADWNETFKEACEEAAILTVHYFYQNKEFTPKVATDEILKMVDWQVSNWGGHFDLTVSQTAELIKEYLGYQKVEVIDNPTIEDIKFQIYQQHPVIVPAAGRELGNPYFRQPGPIYHMLVIKGYTARQFITNDPGTKHGQDYLYDDNIIMNAMHDWNETDINQAPQKIIIIYPN